MNVSFGGFKTKVRLQSCQSAWRDRGREKSKSPLTAIWLAWAELSMLPPAVTAVMRDTMVAMVAVSFMSAS